ncbi:hypothetical protein FACS1894188_01170 [Clostridia bacterium]|nr:hypothetical protein FACS1894188_01170 [Clostridia bacterium]
MKDEISARIFTKLQEKNRQQKELAKYLEIAPSSVNNWKYHRNNPPSEYLAKICDFLECSLEWLVTGEESIPKTNIINHGTAGTNNVNFGTNMTPIQEIISTNNVLQDEETDLIEIYRKLTRKNKNKLFDTAFNLEENKE